jgi:hypothetical protein
MREGPSGRYLILAAVLVVVCLLLLTANIAGTDLGGKGGGLGAVEQLQGVIFPLALGMWAVLLIWFLVRRSKKARNRKQSREEPRSSPWGLVVIFVIIAAVALVSGPMKDTIFNSENGGSNGTSGQDMPSVGGAMETSQIVLIGAFAAVLIALLPLFYRYAKGRTISGEEPGTQMEDVQVLESSIARVQMSTGDDLRDAIISSYQQVLDMARDRLKDADILTPRELRKASVETLGWPEAQMEELTRLFEIARYSQHAIDTEERGRSVECLRAIHAKVAGVGNAQ